MSNVTTTSSHEQESEPHPVVKTEQRRPSSALNPLLLGPGHGICEEPYIAQGLSFTQITGDSPREIPKPPKSSAASPGLWQPWRISGQLCSCSPQTLLQPSPTVSFPRPTSFQEPPPRDTHILTIYWKWV